MMEERSLCPFCEATLRHCNGELLGYNGAIECEKCGATLPERSAHLWRRAAKLRQWVLEIENCIFDFSSESRYVDDRKFRELYKDFALGVEKIRAEMGQAGPQYFPRELKLRVEGCACRKCNEITK
ncbi:MAG: hypothetical protein E6Q97_38570 [Desulfurellales bacterium]|nr:MAG: hypothetical protein E6Q97_38570 [Desulfurellales bacterium]